MVARAKVALLAGMSAVLLGATPPATGSFTANDARNLSNEGLAKALLGERLQAKVIEVERHFDDDGGISDVPTYVEFYTKPQLNTPRINQVCRVDVITVEYDFYEHDQITSKTPLSIARIGATSRYKAFPEVQGEAGSAEFERAQAAECAKMTSARDAFRAPTAGDAQWLAQIQTEYANLANRFKFTCDDFADRTCANARRQLASLVLNKAGSVKKVDCPSGRTGDQVNYCYELAFSYDNGGDRFSLDDEGEVENAEWILTVFAGMRDGFAPVRIRSLKLAHVEKPFPIS